MSKPSASNKSASTTGAPKTGVEQQTLWRDAESSLVPVNERDQIHLRHYGGGTRNCSVVLLHGLHEDGSLFFRDSTALATEAARAGFDVWVPDLRAKGRSWPSLTPELAKEMRYDFHAAVTEDLATVFGEVRGMSADKPVFLVGHGIGGLLWLSFLARWPIAREFVRGMVLLGSATDADTADWRAGLDWQLRAGWYASLLARREGLVPGRATGLGGAAEPPSFFNECRAMLKQGWIDPRDGFDHLAQFAELPSWPATLMLAAENDAPWGGADAARRLHAALPPHDGRLYVFPRSSGVSLLGPQSALAGGTGAGSVNALVLDWLASFDA